MLCVKKVSLTIYNTLHKVHYEKCANYKYKTEKDNELSSKQVQIGLSGGQTGLFPILLQFFGTMKSVQNYCWS